MYVFHLYCNSIVLPVYCFSKMFLQAVKGLWIYWLMKLNYLSAVYMMIIGYFVILSGFLGTCRQYSWKFKRILGVLHSEILNVFTRLFIKISSVVRMFFLVFYRIWYTKPLVPRLLWFLFSTLGSCFGSSNSKFVDLSWLGLGRRFNLPMVELGQCVLRKRLLTHY